VRVNSYVKTFVCTKNTLSDSGHTYFLPTSALATLCTKLALLYVVRVLLSSLSAREIFLSRFNNFLSRFIPKKCTIACELEH